MRRATRIILLAVLAWLGSDLHMKPAQAQALPSLPSSFYGTIKVNGANVPDGTVVQAVINGQPYAEGQTQTHQGSSVYALDVRGDDPATAALDGGRDGDTVQFTIGGVAAAQSGTWHSGTNTAINLTATSSTELSTPRATRTPIPTQTAIVILVQPSATSTPMATSISIQPTIAATEQSVSEIPASSPEPGSSEPALPPLGPGTNPDDESSRQALLPVAVIVVIALAGGAFLLYGRRK